MYNHLKTSDVKGLRESVMLDLGRVNVVCGRNNSGKSTLLEAISDTTKTQAGKRLDDSDIQSIFEGSAKDMGWSSDSPNRPENQRYRELLKSIAATRPAWFEKDDFVEEVKTRFNANVHLSRWTFGEGLLKNAYLSCLGKTLSAVLLPPKRQMDLSVMVNSQEQVRPSGQGLLNYLFTAKNQSETNEDRLIYDGIGEAVSYISSGYRPDIFLGQESTLVLSFRQANRPWIEAKDCGLGLQDLLVILYFAIHPAHEVVIVEEPESHMHPDMQRRLLHFLRNHTDKQYFLSTHSNVFLDNSLVDRVFFTSFTDQVIVDDATSRASILGDLGYSVVDNLVSDMVILVEGPTDVPVIEELLAKMELTHSYDIKMWPLGGDNMAQFDLSVFAERYNIMALVDNDPGSKKVRNQFMQNCEALGIPVRKLKAYSIENYFSIKCLRDVFSDKIPSTLAKIASDKKIEEQVGFSVKGNNRALARAMELGEIKDTDLYEFLLDVKRTLEST